MTANVITYRGRSAAREVGKVLSLEPAQVDRLAKVMNHFEFVDPDETLARNLREVGLDLQHPTIQMFGRLWQQIQDLPRHLGQHSGGMVICQGRLDDVVPLENASMPGRVVVQWDKDDCADMGIVKVDLLGLGMMAVLQDALELVNRTHDSGLGTRDSGSGKESGHPTRSSTPRTKAEAPSSGSDLPPEARIHAFLDEAILALDLAHLPPDDPAVYRMLQEADTIGIFQVESRAQMATLPRLRPERFYDIVVEVAIIRPGPIVGQMVHPYLKRRQGAGAGRRIRIRRSSRFSRGRSACRCSRSSCCGWRWSRPDSPAARPRSCAARSASSDPSSGCSRSKGSCATAWRGRGSPATPRKRSSVDHLVRALRISRVARRELRAARLCERVSEGALSGGVLHGAPQQPADGVLSSVDARQGCAAPRRPLRSDRRAGIGLDVPGRTRRPRPARADVRERPAAGRRPRDRGVAARIESARSRDPSADPGNRPEHEDARSIAVRNAAATISRCSKRHCPTGISATSARTNGEALHDRDRGSGSGIRGSGIPDWGSGLGIGLGSRGMLETAGSEPRTANSKPEPKPGTVISPSTISSPAPASAATSWPRSRISARSTRSATIGEPRCGRSRERCGRRESCSILTTAASGSDAVPPGFRYVRARGQRRRASRLPDSVGLPPEGGSYKLEQSRCIVSARQAECRVPSLRYARCRHPSA